MRALVPTPHTGHRVLTRQEINDRFWIRVVRDGDDECWGWRGSINSNGYGTLSVWGKTAQAHRFSWELANSETLTSHDVILHLCDNPACTNPAHLKRGTQKDNLRDMAAKGRQWCQRKTHCQHGHPFDEVNTAHVRKADGRVKRQCLTCRRERHKQYYESKRATLWGEDAVA